MNPINKNNSVQDANSSEGASNTTTGWRGRQITSKPKSSLITTITGAFQRVLSSLKRILKQIFSPFHKISKKNASVRMINPEQKVEQTATEPPVPENGINIGLPNGGNTCWFNSAMKLMASTSLFDNMLEAGLNDSADQKQVRDALRELIFTLRSGKGPGVIVREDYTKVLDAMKLIPIHGNNIAERNQADPTEFLIQLQDYLGFEQPKKSGLKFVKNYQLPGSDDTEQFQKFGTCTDEETFMLTLDIPNQIEENELLSLHRLIEPTDEVEVRPDVADDQNNRLFTRTWRLASLPDEFLVYLKRWNVEGEKINNRIELNGSGEFEFTLCDPKKDEEGNIIGETPREKTVRYRMAGSIDHRGSSLHGGHYVANLRTSEGPVCHNDAVINSIESKDFGANGFLLLLKKVQDEDTDT
jgi:ubiquitin C-terminal hydrolase